MAASEWVVNEGDSIWNIAAEQLMVPGQPEPTLEQIVVKMEELIKLNLDTLKTPPGKGNPNLIFPGMKLKLTSVPTPGEAVDKGKPGPGGNAGTGNIPGNAGGSSGKSEKPGPGGNAGTGNIPGNAGGSSGESEKPKPSDYAGRSYGPPMGTGGLPAGSSSRLSPADYAGRSYGPPMGTGGLPTPGRVPPKPSDYAGREQVPPKGASGRPIGGRGDYSRNPSPAGMAAYDAWRQKQVRG